MPLVILDQAATAKLGRYGDPVLVCDETGRVLGHFVPAVPAQHLDLEPQISEEELRKREQRTEGRTLAEIMADLEKRS